jgi:hypothetical protein
MNRVIVCLGFFWLVLPGWARADIVKPSTEPNFKYCDVTKIFAQYTEDAKKGVIIEHQALLTCHKGWKWGMSTETSVPSEAVYNVADCRQDQNMAAKLDQAQKNYREIVGDCKVDSPDLTATVKGVDDDPTMFYLPLKSGLSYKNVYIQNDYFSYVELVNQVSDAQSSSQDKPEMPIIAGTDCGDGVTSGNVVEYVNGLQTIIEYYKDLRTKCLAKNN